MPDPRARRSGTRPMRPTTGVSYRGQSFSPARVPIYMGGLKEIPIDPSDPIDQGVRDYFATQNMHVDEKGRISKSFFNGLRLDEMINREVQETEPVLETIGFKQHILPVGRFDDKFYPPSKEDFKRKIGGKEQFDDVYDRDFVSLLEESPKDLAIFMDVADKYLGIPDLSLETLKNKSILERIGKQKFMKLQTAYIAERFGWHKQIQPYQPPKHLDLEFFNDGFISRITDKKTDKKAQGFFTILGKTLYWIDPFSTYGSTVLYVGKKPSDIIPLYRRELELDEGEEKLKGLNAGTKNLEDCFEEGGNVAIVKLTRAWDEKPDDFLFLPQESSPIVFAPLMDLSLMAPQIVGVSTGYVNPYTNRQQNTLFISNIPYSQLKKS